MRKLLLTLALLLIPAAASAQCSGVFGANKACGSVAGGVPGQIDFSSIVGAASRVKLSAATSYYWRNDGNDSFCTGLTNAAYVSGAFPQNCGFQTTAAALTAIAKLDFNSQTVTLMSGVANTTYTTGIVVNSPWIGGGNLIVDLNGGGINESASKAFILTANLSLTGTGVSPPGVGVQNGTLASSAFSCLQNAGVGTLGIGAGITFGACAQYQVEATGTGALIALTGNSYTISGGGLGHTAARYGGVIYDVATTASFSSSVAFSEGYAVAKDGGVVIGGTGTFTLNGHTVTGPRYLVTTNGTVDAADTAGTYWPGSTNGTTSNDGVYGSGGVGVGGTRSSTGVGDFALNISNVPVIDFNKTNANRTTISSPATITGSLAMSGQNITGGGDAAFTTFTGAPNIAAWTTYTPTITAGTGTFTTASAAGAYVKWGKYVTLRVLITITTVGSAGVSVIMTLPPGVTTNGSMFCSGGELTNTKNLGGQSANGATTNTITFFDSTFPGASGNFLQMNCTFEST